MNAFGPTEREQFGQNVRLAMACIKGAPEPTKGCALPQDETSIRERLKALSQEITSNHADLLELLVRFDDKQGWKSCGASHCAAWMNLEIGISTQLSWEYLRVGRILQTLPTVQALFRVGSLSWSKVRLITRVANSENEKILCHAALDASVSDVKRICGEYRWREDEDNEGENARALKQWTSRTLTWDEISNGCTRIQLVLPPEVAQAFLNSVEQSLNQMGTVSSTKDNTLSQSRADAAVLMAETSLQNAGREIASADRYQVMVSIDASELATEEATTSTDIPIVIATSTDTATDIPSVAPTTLPTKRPTLLGVGPIATETARRIACDCSLSINITNKSEPIDIGRKSRIWPNAMARAIKERDQHCVWPGCTHSRHLHIHHIEHWADGGVTSLDNGVCLCSYHHTLAHEGGYTIEHIEGNSPELQEQFIRQQHNDDVSLFDFEKSLRTDEASFNTVRKLSPTRFKYRILNSHGQNISERSSNDAMCAERPAPMYMVKANNIHVDYSSATRANTTDNIHVYSDTQCSEAILQAYYGKRTQSRAKGYAQAFHRQAFTFETPSNYRMTAGSSL